MADLDFLRFLALGTDRVQTSVYFPKEVYAALVKWAEEEDRFRKRTLRERLVICWYGWWWKRRNRSEIGNGDDWLIPARSWSITYGRLRQRQLYRSISG